MSEERPESQSGLRTTVWLFAAVLVLVFLPLGIAMGEHYIFGSDHFEDLCKRGGVFDVLDLIYRPLVNLFR